MTREYVSGPEDEAKHPWRKCPWARYYDNGVHVPTGEELAMRTCVVGVSPVSSHLKGVDRKVCAICPVPAIYDALDRLVNHHDWGDPTCTKCAKLLSEAKAALATVKKMKEQP